MVTIDCACDNEFALELASYLTNHGVDATSEESLVVVKYADPEKILRSFLEDTRRQGYSIRKIDSENFLMSKEVPIEDFGFFRCEMCGYIVSSEEELLIHRRAHGIQLL
ncbi:MAG: hypothetical protein ACREA3_06640 [Nitrosotalea sp.]